MQETLLQVDNINVGCEIPINITLNLQRNNNNNNFTIITTAGILFILK